jgi:hypothetical protein
MTGRARCDEILQLIDEALDAVPSWLGPLPQGPVRFDPTLRTAGELAATPSAA